MLSTSVRYSRFDTWSAVAASGPGEGHEVGLDPGRRGPVGVLAHEEVAHDLAHPGDLFELGARAAPIGQRQVKQLERPIERRSEPPWVVGRPSLDGPTDLGPRVRQLFGQGDRLPAPGGQVAVEDQGVTRRSTISATAARVPGSSTERDRLPWDGRMLITESNSMKSGPPDRPG